MDNPSQMAAQLAAQEARNAELEAQLNIAEERAARAEAITCDVESILVGDLARILAINGIEIGQNRLFEWLREHSYLNDTPGPLWNTPTRWARDQGWFDSKINRVQMPYSQPIVATPTVTVAGQAHIIAHFLNDRNPS